MSKDKGGNKEKKKPASTEGKRQNLIIRVEKTLYRRLNPLLKRNKYPMNFICC